MVEIELQRKIFHKSDCNIKATELIQHLLIVSFVVNYILNNFLNKILHRIFNHTSNILE